VERENEDCLDAQVDRLDPSRGLTELSAGLKARN